MARGLKLAVPAQRIGRSGGEISKTTTKRLAGSIGAIPAYQDSYYSPG